jgi:hypothetical protein
MTFMPVGNKSYQAIVSACLSSSADFENLCESKFA